MAGPAALSETSAGLDGLAVSLRGVTKVYDSGVMALGPLDLDVARGEFVSLLGPSGCGKSTALRLVAGLSAPTSGTVLVSRDAGEPRGKHAIGFVFQEPTLMPWATVAGNVALLLDGESDFLLTYAHPNVPLYIDPERFAYRCLGTEAAIPVSIPDAQGNPVHALHPSGPPISYLSYGACSFFGRGLIKLLAERPLPLTTVYENAMSAGLKAMALAGCGVGWIPESLVNNELQSGQLVIAGDPSWHLPTEIRLYRASARCRPAVERFWAAIDDADQRIGNRPPLQLVGAA